MCMGLKIIILLHSPRVGVDQLLLSRMQLDSDINPRSR